MPDDKKDKKDKQDKKSCDEPTPETEGGTGQGDPPGDPD